MNQGCIQKPPTARAGWLAGWLAGIAEIKYSGKRFRRLSYAAQHINNANCRVRELSETRSAAPLCKPAYPGGPGSVQTTPKSLRSEKYHKFLWQGLYLEAAHRTGWLAGWAGLTRRRRQRAGRFRALRPRPAGLWGRSQLTFQVGACPFELLPCGNVRGELHDAKNLPGPQK